MNKIQKFIESNKVVSTIFLVFVLATIYTIIGSGVQENKEKAVLQERARLQEVAKEPLNQCLENIDEQAKADIDSYESLVRDPVVYSDCLNPPAGIGHGSKVEGLIASGNMTLAEYCRPPTIDEQLAQKQKILDKAKVDKEECYKRFK
jgi:hypothetical protein